MQDIGAEQLIMFPTRENNTLDILITTYPGQFENPHSPDKLSNHDMIITDYGHTQMSYPEKVETRKNISTILHQDERRDT